MGEDGTLDDNLSMRPGVLYLSRMSAEFIRQKTSGTVEVGPVECSRCGAKYRLFTPGRWQEKDATSLDWGVEVNDLRERAQFAVGKDCPQSVPEGQPRRGEHWSIVYLYESGKYGV